LWVLAEWLRGTILTGFPWLSAGYAAIDSPLAGFAPLGGTYLLSLLTAGAAVLLWMIAVGQARIAAAAGFAAIGLAG
ncbi:apolipoprotein N-acyltransferase, partial [Klebsiella pneumoniae]|nr:apolipoprotein N-acyltransferase [Klebsiella pneumoniae]